MLRGRLIFASSQALPFPVATGWTGWKDWTRYLVARFPFVSLTELMGGVKGVTGCGR